MFALLFVWVLKLVEIFRRNENNHALVIVRFVREGRQAENRCSLLPPQTCSRSLPQVFPGTPPEALPPKP